MLSDTALSLMRDVFERPDLFRTAPRITRRVVQWGQETPSRRGSFNLSADREPVLWLPALTR